MKKLLLTMLAAVAVLTGCKNDEPKGGQFVTDVQMPALTEQFSAGDVVRIPGTGFLATDVIKLRSGSNDAAVEALIITAAQVTFTLPSELPSGENSIVLKRGAGEQILGNITVAETKPFSLYGLGWATDKAAGVQTELYQLNPVTGLRSQVKTFPDNYGVYEALAIGQTMYGLGVINNDWKKQQHIVSYNFNTGEFKKVSDRIANLGNDVLGVIDGQLHSLSCVDYAVKLFLIDNKTGGKTEVVNFGKIDNAARFNGFAQPTGGFAYDAKNKKIAILARWFDQQATFQSIVLDVQTITMTYSLPISNSVYYMLRGDKVCAINVDATDVATVYALDDEYRKGAPIASVSDAVSYVAYDVQQDFIYGFTSEFFYSLDLKATPARQKSIKQGKYRIGELVLSR